MDSQQQNPVAQEQIVDDDEVPPQYRVKRSESEYGPKNSGSTKSGDPPIRQKVQSTQRPGVVPVSESSSLTAKASRAWSAFLSPGSQQSSSNTKDKRTQKDDAETQKWSSNVDETHHSHNQLDELKHSFRRKEFEWNAREKNLQRQIYQIQQSAAEMEQGFQAKFRDIQLEKASLEGQHIAFIRKQQEESFKQMETARWLPMDESKVISELDRLKRDMRMWAKTNSIKEISFLDSLQESDFAALMGQLSNVVNLENGQLPKSILNTPKSPILLLNALLTYHVYINLFRSPFFFVQGTFGDCSCNGLPESILGDIYERAKRVNPQDANIWRSHTLRLLKPPSRHDMSDNESELCRTTDMAIELTAQHQATAFLAGPASFLMPKDVTVNATRKLTAIFNEAAKKSYMLWTRRTEMICYTLRDIETPGFDAESPFFDPDTFMRHEDREDQLKERPITVLVHPLLQVAGTDEAKDYDQERVWVKGVVWLDSKIDGS